MHMFPAADYLDLNQTEHRTLFDNSVQIWDALKQIGSYLQFRLKPAMYGRVLGRPYVGPAVYVGNDTVIENGATIKGPAWIGNNCQLRSGCYVRENVIVGDNVVLGNSCEFKNCIVFNDAAIPHFNYVGDSILGHKAHLGAGVILSNVKLDRSEISVRFGSQLIPTGLRKFGAVIGDRTEIGCNAVLNPGSILGRDSLVYPLTHFGGVLPSNTILKNRQEVQQVPRQ
jgi:UDP-N-acetylglucosamine diphosphorylase / glucose-1-phosphate thymidylyltransferase / UDP-N-acetylgalactosamine diphosphorylase / glucosamine-1-phosphate N-acetyltransferase / galactosamine-1-phosphate N-acetyltransferase